MMTLLVPYWLIQTYSKAKMNKRAEQSRKKSQKSRPPPKVCGGAVHRPKTASPAVGVTDMPHMCFLCSPPPSRACQRQAKKKNDTPRKTATSPSKRRDTSVKAEVVVALAVPKVSVGWILVS